MPRIYVDFDDVLCETARAILPLGRTLFQKDLAYEDIKQFELEITYDLTPEEFLRLVMETHTDAFLQGLRAVPGACTTVKHWLSAGVEVSVVTGRPITTACSSARWLKKHGLADVEFLHVDKYNRWKHRQAPEGFRPTLSLQEFQAEHFDLAVEDAPPGLTLLKTLFPAMPVAVYDRPWNQTWQLQDACTRCRSWREVEALWQTR